MTNRLVSHENNSAVIESIVKFEDFQKTVQEAYLKNRGGFNIPGFRKGKAPRKIIEANYGKEVFYSDALDILMPKAYVEAVEELNLFPIGRPQGDMEEIEEGKDIVLKFTVETKPEIDLNDYSEIEVEKLETEVSDDDVDHAIWHEREKNKIIKTVADRPLKEGDTAVIDFEGFKDGVAFEGGKGENFDLVLGSNTFIPGFEDQLIGKNSGDEYEIEVTFPDDYHQEDLKGQKAVFKGSIKEIKETIIPELDDDFVVDVSEFDTVEQYKADMKEKLNKQLEEQNKAKLENAVVDKLIEMNEVPAPDVMVEDQIDSEVEQYKQQLQQMGIGYEMFIKATNSTEEDVRNQYKDRATQQVKAEIVLDAVVKKENIEVSDQEVSDEYLEIAKQYKKENDEKFIEQIKKAISKDYVKSIISKKKAIDLLIKNVKFVERKEEHDHNHAHDHE